MATGTHQNCANRADAEFYCLLSGNARETNEHICNEASPRQPDRLYRRGFCLPGSLTGLDAADKN